MRKPFKEIVVFIDYRFDAGSMLPVNRVLRARVKQCTSESEVFGINLLAPKSIYDVRLAECMAVGKLTAHASNIRFEYQPLLLEQALKRSGWKPA